MLLVSGATATLRRYDSPYLGHLLTPHVGNSANSLWMPFACDNGAFGGFEPLAFIGLLARIGHLKPLWVACPDVLCDWENTLKQYAVWAPVIAALGLSRAVVIQNGATIETVPWDDCEAVFIGGCTDWKLGFEAEEISSEAKSRGKWLHMGRVNSRKRMRYASAIGCDSVDGSGFSKWPDERIPLALKWLEQTRDAPLLFPS